VAGFSLRRDFSPAKSMIYQVGFWGVLWLASTRHLSDERQAVG
jgi:hypothetical protein